MTAATHVLYVVSFLRHYFSLPASGEIQTVIEVNAKVFDENNPRMTKN